MSNPTPPGPKGKPIIGVAPEFQRDILGVMVNTARDYGDIAVIPFGPFRLWLLSNPDLFHQVLVSDSAKFKKSTRQRNALGDIIGNGIFLSEGDFWKRQRRLVAPAFHTKRIGAYADVMVNRTQQMLEAWRSGETRNVDSDMTALTMNIISETMFGSDVSEGTAQISDLLNVGRKLLGTRFKAVILKPMWLPTPTHRQWKRAQPQLNAVIQSFIDERRKTGEDRGDLLSMLLLAQDEDGSVMTDKQVFDEAVTIFGAGHETTAAALSWAFYLIATHPEIADKLYAEVDAAIGDRPATLADLPNLKYAEMIFKETMRLYPPAFASTREPIEDVQIGEYTVKKGAPVMLNFYGVQRDPRFWNDPDKFNPERFSPENEKSIPKHAYIPFGAGPRVCIGNGFAIMEATLVLATIAQHFRFELAADHGQQGLPDTAFTLRPQGGVWLKLTQREPARQPEMA
ncbi:MAG: cytochrome P450 [Burkholderiales bacterium]|nr:cytochrome P450 [Anaerolineae bacterium]